MSSGSAGGRSRRFTWIRHAFWGWCSTTSFDGTISSWCFSLLAYFGAQNLVRSRVGRAFIAIRDRDVAAEIIGVNIFKYKLLAFPSVRFTPVWLERCGPTIYVLPTMRISRSSSPSVSHHDYYRGLGGVLGSVLGAIFIELLPLSWISRSSALPKGSSESPMRTWPIFLANFQLLVFGALIIIFLTVEPEGLARLWENIKRYFRLWPYSY